MIRPGRSSSHRGVRLLLAALLLALLLPAAGTAAAATKARGSAVDQGTPLSIDLQSLSPGVLPSKGRVVLSGTVTNTQSTPWTAVKVYAFASTTPITSSDELAQAVTTPADVEVGQRVVTPRGYADVGDLAPGQTRRFRISVPRNDLPIPKTPGVYWIGVHALGANSLGFDSVADGRARTFIPVLGRKPSPVQVALTVPLRARVRRTADNALRDPQAWARLTSPSGRLGRLLAFAESAGPQPFTLVLDPAVLDAARSVETAQTAASGAGARGTAEDWLRRLGLLTTAHSVVALGYDDPDVSSLAARAPKLLRTSYQQSRLALQHDGLQAQLGVVPADGYLNPIGLRRATAELGDRGVVLLSDHGVAHDQIVWRLPHRGGDALLIASDRATSGGPVPPPTGTALAVRQRLLCEAALRSLAGSSQPVIASLPATWDPGASWQRADFFGQLRQPWISLTGLPDASRAPAWTGTVPYPASARDAEVGSANVRAARGLITQADSYADALVTPGQTRTLYARIALQAVSTQARVDRHVAASQVGDVSDAIRGRLDGISVIASPFVTLSGSSGTFVVTLVNSLSVPVHVGLAGGATSSGIQITGPKDLQLPAGQRTTVKVLATSSHIGVQTVTLTPVTSTGAAVGTPTTLQVRVSEVSGLIWGVMLAGAALLAVMIVRRVRQRGFHTRAEDGEV